MSDKTITTLHPDVRERFLIENFDILSIQGSLESMDCIFLQQIILMGRIASVVRDISNEARVNKKLAAVEGVSQLSKMMLDAQDLNQWIAERAHSIGNFVEHGLDATNGADA